jgi:hypothetical protein
MDANARDKLCSRIPARRLGDPADIAEDAERPRAGRLPE